MSTTENTPATSESETGEKKASKFVVASQVRDLVKSKGLCVGGDLIEALSSKVEALLNTAALRTEANGRKTVRGHDL